MSDKRLCDLSPRGLLRFLAERKISPSTARGLAIVAAWLWNKTEQDNSRIQLADFYCAIAGITVTTKSLERLMEPVSTDARIDSPERCPFWLLELVRPYPLLVAKLEPKKEHPRRSC